MSIISKARILEKKTFLIDQLPNITSYLDSGLDKTKHMLLVLRKYKYDNPKADAQTVRKTVKFCLLLIHREEFDNLEREEIIFHDNVKEPRIAQKLNNEYYTTIRVDSPFYEVGKEYNVVCFTPMSKPEQSDIY